MKVEEVRTTPSKLLEVTIICHVPLQVLSLQINH